MAERHQPQAIPEVIPPPEPVIQPAPYDAEAVQVDENAPAVAAADNDDSVIEEAVRQEPTVDVLQDAVHPELISQLMDTLRVDHECTHSRWTYIQGPHQCEECFYNLPQYIFECDQCRILACWRCRRNRL